jgi:hypothetical protein
VVLFVLHVNYYYGMNSLTSKNIQAVFESRPRETAAWLIAFDSFAAISRVVKDAKPVHYEEEFAARKLVSSIGNGDFRSTFGYFVTPERYPERIGLKRLAIKLGAVSLRGRIDPALMATLSYRTDRSARQRIPDDMTTLKFYESAHTFPAYFEGVAEHKFASDETASLADLVLEIKNDSSLWIDRDPVNV